MRKIRSDAQTTKDAGDDDLRLADVDLREEVELVRFDLPMDQVEPLLERGFMPGCRLCPIRVSPAGDPIVMVDGSLLALRREMAGCLCVRKALAETRPAPDAQHVA